MKGNNSPQINFRFVFNHPRSWSSLAGRLRIIPVPSRALKAFGNKLVNIPGIDFIFIYKQLVELRVGSVFTEPFENWSWGHWCNILYTKTTFFCCMLEVNRWKYLLVYLKLIDENLLLYENCVYSTPLTSAGIDEKYPLPFGSAPSKNTIKSKNVLSSNYPEKPYHPECIIDFNTLIILWRGAITSAAIYIVPGSWPIKGGHKLKRTALQISIRGAGKGRFY